MKKAFTLVEMLIVVIIIGILIAALLPKITWAQAKSRDTARKAAITQIAPALQMYYDDNGEYPTGNCTEDLSWDSMKQYMREVPTDPQKNRIVYGTKNGGCTKYFGYTPVKNSGWDKGGYVLVANMESYGKMMNYVLSGSDYDTNPLFDTGDDLVDLIENKCDEGVTLSWTDTVTGCTKTSKTWALWKHKNAQGVYVSIWG